MGRVGGDASGRCRGAHTAEPRDRPVGAPAGSEKVGTAPRASLRRRGGRRLGRAGDAASYGRGRGA
eukprot:3292621-Pleurochrysis_carterae.AAC.1